MSTGRNSFAFVPIIYNILPFQVVPHSINRRELWFLRGWEESSVLETNNIPALWLPSFEKLRGTRWRYKSNSIGSREMMMMMMMMRQALSNK